MCLPINLKELAITGCVKSDLLYNFVVVILVLIYLLHYFFICRLILPPKITSHYEWKIDWGKTQ